MDDRTSLIKYFDNEFIRKKSITGIHVKEKLYSRKNDVYKIEVSYGKDSDNFILKKYRGPGRDYRIRNEIFFYDLLKNNAIKIPDIFYKGKDILVTDIISGRTLLDYIIQAEHSADITKLNDPGSFKKYYPPLVGVCNYIYVFNRILKEKAGRSFVLNDMNLRNFLLCGSQICRVDLEECREGDVEEDIGKFIAFLITYESAHTEWKISISESIKEYCRSLINIDIKKTGIETGRELKRMAKRRR